MGFTAAQQQREEILAAVESMTWTDTPDQPPHLDGAAVRAIVAAVFHRRRDLIQLVGIAQLDGGRQLIACRTPTAAAATSSTSTPRPSTCSSSFPTSPTACRPQPVPRRLSAPGPDAEHLTQKEPHP